jgi:sulfur relay (sulfurtransferase) DsrC/TusE family protein
MVSMGGRRKRESPEAERTTVSLTPRDQLALELIRTIRKYRKEKRTTPGQILADGIWLILTTVEKISSDRIDALLPPVARPAEGTSKIREFPKPEKS